MTDPQQLDIRPDPARVIGRLTQRLADLESENAQLEDVIRQLLEQRNDTARAAELNGGGG